MEMQAEAEHRKRLFCFCSVGLFLAILESQKEVSEVLLPSLMQLGLTNLLASLLASEMTKLSGEKIPERYSVLDVILRAIEALSTVDCLSQEICCNKELFQLVCDLVKLPDKAEVFNSCATAAVLIANIMSDVPDFASDISHGNLNMILYQHDSLLDQALNYTGGNALEVSRSDFFTGVA